MYAFGVKIHRVSNDSSHRYKENNKLVNVKKHIAFVNAIHGSAVLSVICEKSLWTSLNDEHALIHDAHFSYFSV